ncbi:transcriptional regulator, XRE family [Desulfofarcimen acetoxidans DSM 771]|uniref:Transcriptional regulator, XRE family n=1 Tax=Desulfofarcimen acetoxidans (strain ATCC 49208 / DSM 771 / KCTC 5769 / VKM B-1644 / 5575) TaxID=485916 RepID=C8VWK3_DESAS|nr:helix-turn-helix transcriptional regulator [Desulfofarcimen acetoxidans]ACV64367.1 transcriptional regulator, XRE family [Desulfofarcimen acetoxidans DSM 771]
MPIKSNLSRILGERRIKMSELAKDAGIAKNTALALYHERAKGITFDVLEKICLALNCQPGDLFECMAEGDDGSSGSESS